MFQTTFMLCDQVSTIVYICIFDFFFWCLTYSETVPYAGWTTLGFQDGYDPKFARELHAIHGFQYGITGLGISITFKTEAF